MSRQLPTSANQVRKETALSLSAAGACMTVGALGLAAETLLGLTNSLDALLVVGGFYLLIAASQVLPGRIAAAATYLVRWRPDPDSTSAKQSTSPAG